MDSDYMMLSDSKDIELDVNDNSNATTTTTGGIDATRIARLPTTLTQGPYLEHMASLFPYSGTAVYPGSLDCFSATLGRAYWDFISKRTTWVNDFGNHWLPSYDRFSWLNPYTGNAHNRA